jgi:hypothetical protein
LPPILTIGLLLATVFSKLPSTINSVASALPTKARPPARMATPRRLQVRADCFLFAMIIPGLH